MTDPEETFRGTMRGSTPDGDFTTVIVTRKGGNSPAPAALQRRSTPKLWRSCTLVRPAPCPSSTAVSRAGLRTKLARHAQSPAVKEFLEHTPAAPRETNCFSFNPRMPHRDTTIEVRSPARS